MIPRYSRPEMVALWSADTKFRIWFEIEAHACDAQAALGVIPKANAEAVWRAATDPSCPMRLPAGADAVARAGGA